MDLDELQKAFNTVTRLVNEATLVGHQVTSLERQVDEYISIINDLREQVWSLTYDTLDCRHDKFKVKRGPYCPQCGRVPNLFPEELSDNSDGSEDFGV